MHDDPEHSQAREDSLIRRMFKNAGLLLSGKGAAGVLGLAYMALTAQTLGVTAFGTLMLIHAYVRLVWEITTFKSWQAVIRYGAEAIAQDDRPAFQGLIKFTTLLDIVMAVIGTLIAAAAVPLVGDLLNWDADTRDMALLYSVLVLFSIKATPVGLLRLFDRFDLIALQSLIMPGTRLMGATIAWALGAGLWGFVFVWLSAGILSGILMIALGWYEFHKRGFTAGLDANVKGLARRHTGIWSFVWISNLNATLELATTHAATLLVGFVVGPAGAGLFKVAQESSEVLAKPTGLFTQSIYPELAKLSSGGQTQRIWQIVRRTGLMVGAGAGAVLIVTALLGKFLLGLVFGSDYVAAYPILLYLIVSGVLAMVGFALSPAMYAIGRPDIPLKVKGATSVLHLVLTYYLLALMGLVGAGIAAATSAFLTLIAMTAISMNVLAQAHSAPAE